ncbi:DUF305 domain-containing protein [Nocardia puris]|uniref:DUF305 domain-containing protein n=1 Tax=Nocardia puris TaxID=208602 RepID=UPI001895EA02|nr:DUF305 domain-containing protein [Nocardia puris]MBF6210737.1 DUF305 domain-containing protein [Nocardia puris]MBF6364333.1 DUF305 domain-containing protein [Nocardia puris]MBF6459262.1 DUF305 domain-containing protein [Nocardia puris]
MSRTRTRVAVTAVAAAAALFAAGCSDDTESTTTADHGTHATTASATTAPAARTDFTDADVMFLQMMYPHHAQAVEMAQLVPSRTQNAALRDLAANVEAAQAPEMAQISTLLVAFGQPAPTADASAHGDHGMAGMMTPEQMAALEAASGDAFDRMWLEMMIEHHLGAVDMAKTELAEGVNPDAQALARTVIADQEAEITTMRQMLGQN